MIAKDLETFLRNNQRTVSNTKHRTQDLHQAIVMRFDDNNNRQQVLGNII